MSESQPSDPRSSDPQPSEPQPSTQHPGDPHPGDPQGGVGWSLSDLLAEGERIHVLDLGAALSQGPLYQSLFDLGKVRITGFEPDDQSRQELEALYGPPHIFHPHFVADGKPATFHQTNWSLTGSLYEPNTPLLSMFHCLEEVMHPVARHEVQTVALDAIEAISSVDVIKIDVQGSELSVLENATRILKDVLLIQVEVEFVSLYKNQPMFADVDRFLRSVGFQFHTFESIAGRSFAPFLAAGGPFAPVKQFLWADAIYLADWMHLEHLTTDRLRRFAVLAHDLLHSYDLAHLVLQELDRRSGERSADLYRLMHNQLGDAGAPSASSLG